MATIPPRSVRYTSCSRLRHGPRGDHARCLDSWRRWSMTERRRTSTGQGPASGVSRRLFLELSVAGAVTAGAARLGVAQETRANGIPYRTLGRTGEKVSLVGVGGAHLGRLDDEQEAIRIV